MRYDFTGMMESLLHYIVSVTPQLGHVEMDRVLVTMTRQRSRWRDGLFAKVVPLRFKEGAATTQHHGRTYEAPRVVHDGVELLYVLSFCLPRFLNRTFEEKIETTFHELYHISPAFNGDIRRYGPGDRLHTRHFHEAVGRMAARFLQDHDESYTRFLVPAYGAIKRKYGDVLGTTFRIPQPRPIACTADRGAIFTNETRGDL